MQSALTPDLRRQLDADLLEADLLERHAKQQAGEARNLGEDADSIDLTSAIHAANASGLRRALGY